jgi:hypothetical protein
MLPKHAAEGLYTGIGEQERPTRATAGSDLHVMQTGMSQLREILCFDKFYRVFSMA